MSPGLGLQYFQGITERLDFMGSLSGSYVKYPFSYYTGVPSSTDSKFLLENFVATRDRGALWQAAITVKVA